LLSFEKELAKRSTNACTFVIFDEKIKKKCNLVHLRLHPANGMNRKLAIGIDLAARRPDRLE